MKKIRFAVMIAMAFAAALVLAMTAAFQNRKLQRYQGQFFDCFDTVTTITGYAGSQEEFSENMGLLQERLLHYHKLFDIYHTYDGMNNMKTVNDAAGKGPVQVDPEIIVLLKLAREMQEQTGGKIQAAYGSVLSLWHDYREQGNADPGQAQLPSMQELEQRGQHTRIEDVVLNPEDSTVSLADPELSLDVGSIGKGYAVQRLAEYARELGMEHVLISVGGNVCAAGPKADGTPWLVGVENPDPDSSQPYVCSVEVSDQSIVTSGDYQRYYEVDGVRYCHIIDPDTHMPPGYFSSVSVMGMDSGMADALSTALFNMEYEEGLALVESLKDVEAMWIGKDGKIRCSSGFKMHEKK